MVFPCPLITEVILAFPLHFKSCKNNELTSAGGGEGGIRTHVPGSSPDKALSRRSRYGHFGTSPGLDELPG